MDPLPSASELPRVALCVGSAAMPQIDRHTDDATRGNALHLYLQHAGKLGRDAALDLVPVQHREACEALDLSRLPTIDPEQYVPELALGFDLQTGLGRELHRKGDRDYSMVGLLEFHGTADVVAMTAEGGVFVADYKTGHKSVSPARSHLQLQMLALAAARAYGVDRADVAIIYVHDDLVSFDTATFLELDLDNIESYLDDLASEIYEARAAVVAKKLPALNPGERQCRYCPALLVCPAAMSVAHAMAIDPVTEIPVESVVAVMTDEQILASLDRVELALPLLEAAKVALKARLFRRPARREDGTIVCAQEQSREVISTPGAVEALLAPAFGAELAARTVEREVSSSKGLIKRALAPEVARRKAEAKARGESTRGITAESVHEEAFRLLRDAGAMRLSTFLMLKELQPKRPVDENEPFPMPVPSAA